MLNKKHQWESRKHTVIFLDAKQSSEFKSVTTMDIDGDKDIEKTHDKGFKTMVLYAHRHNDKKDVVNFLKEIKTASDLVSDL